MEDNDVNEICVIGKELTDDMEFAIVLQTFKVPVSYADGVNIDPQNDANDKKLYVLKDFIGEAFEILTSANRPVMGSTAVVQYKNNQCQLKRPSNDKPIHNLHMKDAIVCFGRFVRKEDADGVLKLVKSMGGTTRSDVSPKVTHLVAQRTSGIKYRKASNYGITVVSRDWIDHVWDNRFNSEFNACSAEVISRFVLKPFSGLSLTFIGFESSELEEMIQLTIANGGNTVTPEDCKCTHFVIDAIPGDPIVDFDFKSVIQKHQHVVYKEWFWASIEIQYRSDESKADHTYLIEGSKNYLKKKSTPQRVSINSQRNSLNLFSPNFDCSSSLDCSELLNTQSETSITVTDFASFTKRRKICTELFETEKNYVNVLNTIIKVFKEPLENPGEFGDKLLDDVEIGIIFRDLNPIIKVHNEILLKLEPLINNWNENHIIGKIFVDHSPQFLTAYPHYFNFHQNTTDTIEECDKKNPRFHAFLKRCQSKPECKRQSLKELLIYPAQRLQRFILLLGELVRNTDEGNPDLKYLNDAIGKIRDVLNKLDESKGKTEGQFTMFDLVNDIKGCPVTLLSSKRNFITKIDVKLLIRLDDNEIIVFKDNLLTILLFTDLLEICKKRSLKRSASISKRTPNAGPNPNGGPNKKSYEKAFKHIETIYFENIKCIYFNDELPNSFVIRTFENAGFDDNNILFYPFCVDEKEVEINRAEFLRKLCDQIKINNAMGIEENTLQPVDLRIVDFTVAHNLANLSNKSKFGLLKTKEKLSRTFTLRSSDRRQSLAGSGTKNSMHTLHANNMNSPSSLPPPSPSSAQKLGRAFSHLISPFHNSFGSPNWGLSHRIGSLTSLNEITETPNDGTFSLPSTPAPKKKLRQTNVTQGFHDQMTSE